MRASRLQYVSFVLLIYVFLMLLLVACGGAGGGTSTTTASDAVGTSSPCDTGSGPKTLCEIQLSPTVSGIAVGARVQLSATALYSDATKEDVTSTTVWSSSNNLTAFVTDSVNDKGSVVGVSPGNVAISAMYSGKHTAIQLEVAQAQLLSIELSKQAITLASGSQITLQATGHYSNSTSYDITGLVTWLVGDTAVATISTSAGNTATLSGVNSGNTVLRVTYDGVSASTTLTVTGTTLDSLVIEPETLSMAMGVSTPLTAIGYYSDGRVEDVTDLAVWSSLDNAVVSVNTTTQKGSVTAKGVGNTTVVASLNGIEANTTVTITDAVLTELSITPPVTSLVMGSQMQLRAVGIYSDYTTRDLTASVVWTSSDSSIASVDNAITTSGTLTAVNAGEVEISATIDGVVVSHHLQVTDVQLIGINVTASRPSIAAGVSLLLTATANFSDGSTQDITDFAEWSVSDTTVASVQRDETSRDVKLKGLQAGIVLAVASYKGKTANAQLSITSAVLTTISIDNADITLARGTSARLTVTGHYSDASTADISSNILWSSSQTSVASVSTTGTELGVISAKASGTTIITASVIGDSAISDAINVAVTDATLQSIIITPSSASIPNNSMIQFTAQGQFSDTSTQDITENVTWLSQTPEIAQVSNVSGSKGLVYGIANASTGDGTAKISATITNSLGLVEAMASINVTYEPQRPVNITVRATPNTILNNGVDATVLQSFLKASETGVTVADGTMVNYEIISGSGVLSASSVASVNGMAEVSLSSTVNAVIIVKATIRNTSISNYVVIVATDSFANLILKYVSSEYVYDSGTNLVQANSRFYLYVHNLSNRTFTLDKYEFLNGATVLKTVTDFSMVNNQLETGTIYGVRLNVQPQLQNNGITARFTISDPVTGQSFVVSHTYVLTP